MRDAIGEGLRWCPFRRKIPPKLKEYLDANRCVYLDNNRHSLPPVIDPDEPLQIDSLGLIRLVAFLENDLGYRVEDEELAAENSRPFEGWDSYLRLKRRLGPQANPRMFGMSRAVKRSDLRDQSASH
jgi:hypothetical protein